MKHLSEHEYEEWFEKHLRDVESLNSANVADSPLAHAPKPIDRNRWLLCLGISLLGTLAISCVCAVSFDKYGGWAWNWFGNALLSLSVGLLASFILMIYTNIRERNIAFYTDVIPDMERKNQNMRKAYFDYTFQINIEFNAGNYENCYQAWEINSNTCFVILDFLLYLITVLPFTPESMSGLTATMIERAKDNILDCNREIQSEFFSSQTISKETKEKCYNSTYCGMNALLIVEDIIKEFKGNLYGMKYGKTPRGLFDNNGEMTL